MTWSFCPLSHQVFLHSLVPAPFLMTGWQGSFRELNRLKFQNVVPASFFSTLNLYPCSHTIRRKGYCLVGSVSCNCVHSCKMLVLLWERFVYASWCREESMNILMAAGHSCAKLSIKCDCLLAFDLISYLWIIHLTVAGAWVLDQGIREWGSHNCPTLG